MKSILHTLYFLVIYVEFLNQTSLHQAPIAIQGDHFGKEKNIYVLVSDGLGWVLKTRVSDYGSAIDEWVFKKAS